MLRACSAETMLRSVYWRAKDAQRKSVAWICVTAAMAASVTAACLLMMRVTACFAKSSGLRHMQILGVAAPTQALSLKMSLRMMIDGPMTSEEQLSLPLFQPCHILVHNVSYFDCQSMVDNLD